MSTYYKAALKLKYLTVDQLILFIKTVIAAMTGNLSAPNPNPNLTTLGNANTDLENSKATVAATKNAYALAVADQDAKRRIVERLITTEAEYVNSVAQGNKVIIESCGMPVTDEHSPVHLGQVENFSLTRGDNAGSVDAHWHAIPKANGYTVEISHTAPDLTGNALWVFYNLSTKSSITITGLTSGSNIWARACANGSGSDKGAYSDPAMLIVP